MNAEPPPWYPCGHRLAEMVQGAGALASLRGVHGWSGYEWGSHIIIDTHGATESSNQCATSEPGV